MTPAEEKALAEALEKSGELARAEAPGAPEAPKIRLELHRKKRRFNLRLLEEYQRRGGR